MADTIRWGILSTGNIAKKFAEGLKGADNGELVAVGSRSQASADAFGDQFDVPRRHPSYEALAADPEVDAIYVATPHPFHKENTILCLEAGKAVLCEKPFAINAKDAQAMIDCAKANKVFLMEAMWTQCLPAVQQAKAWLRDGTIGSLQMVEADFGFRCGGDPESRLMAPKLGGGGLLDVGVYTIAMACAAFADAPDRVSGLAHIGETGVDEWAAMTLGWPSGGLAKLACGVRCNLAHDCELRGTEGLIEIPGFWHATKAVMKFYGDREDVVFEEPFRANGYEYEAMEVGRCLQAGKLESDIVPHSITLTVLKAMDALRGQWGLRYPME